MDKELNISAASREDMSEMADLFFNHISAHQEYISHGELQMGIAQLLPAGTSAAISATVSPSGTSAAISATASPSGTSAAISATVSSSGTSAATCATASPSGTSAAISATVSSSGTSAASVPQIAPDAREKWLSYLQWHIEHPECAFVAKALMEDGTIGGFTVAEIQEDGDLPFGVICDILVREDLRGKGIGSNLLDKALDWLRHKDLSGIYLESGLHNHSAHEYFKKRGFRQVSEIYRLEE